MSAKKVVKRRIFGVSRSAELVASTCWYNNKMLVTELGEGPLKHEMFYQADGTPLTKLDEGYLYRVEVLRMKLRPEENIVAIRAGSR